LISEEDIQRQASRLQGVFNNNIHLSRGSKSKAPLQDAAAAVIYREELATLYDQIDSGKPLDEVLGNVESDTHGNDGIEIDVNSPLERAWRLDQAAILEAEEQTLDEVRPPFLRIAPRDHI
jgi:hypothetical protein